MLKAPWVHTSPSLPCPICGRAKTGNRCILIPGKVVQCYYAISNEPRRSTTAGESWLHRLDRGDLSSRPRIKTVSASPASSAPRRNDLHILAQKFRSRITLPRIGTLSRDLGLSVESLQRLDVGWSDGEPMHVERLGEEVPVYAYSFPRRDAAGKVIGLNMRTPKGRKFAFTGSGGGLHIPRGFGGGGRAFLCEGPTDTAAAVDLGLNVFGRVSCSSDVELVIAFVQAQNISELVIFSQRDAAHYRPDGTPYYPAQDGAEVLAVQLLAHLGDVRVIMPPAFERDKDVRDWKRRGATAGDVERLVMEASPRRLSVTVNIRNRKGNGVCRTIQL
jgi:hypothetical protein